MTDEVVWPQTEEELKKLPSIGEYTARAVLCFAFDQQVAVIDTNVKKVIGVTFFHGNIPEKSLLEKIAVQLLPKGKAYEWNQALMDYASAVLKDHKIPLPKQSKFKDSNRYFRGEILRVLLKEEKSSIEKLQKHFQTLQKELSPERLQKILTTLEKDKFILREGENLSLSE
jgi:A/G-specific adenine glycosylase